MGRVAVTFRVNVEQGADIEGVKGAIQRRFSPQEIKEVPLAFGIVALSVLLVFEDAAGADTDRIAEELQAIEGVASAESGDTTLI